VNGPAELVLTALVTTKSASGYEGGFTVTVKLQLVLLPQESLAMVVTKFVPMGKKLPLGGTDESVSGELQPP